MSKWSQWIGFVWSFGFVAFALHGQSPVKVKPVLGPVKVGQASASLTRIAFGKPRLILGERTFIGLGALADMNMDGTQDVVFGGTFFLEKGGTFSFMTLDDHVRRSGSQRFQSPSKNPTHSFPHVVSGDLDEDGLPDVIGIGGHGGIAIHLRRFVTQKGERLGQVFGFQSTHLLPRETNPAQFGASMFHPRVIRCMDLDDDGHEDLLLAGDFSGISRLLRSSGLLFFRGDGHGNLARAKLLVAGRVLQVETVRRDGSGPWDLFVLGDLGQVTRLRARSDSGYDVETWLLTAIRNAEILRIRDVDQDGRQDFVILANRPSKNRIELAVYPGMPDSRPGASWTRAIDLGKGPGLVESWLVEDMDGDGYPDLGLLLADETGQMGLRLLAGGPGTPWIEQQTLVIEARLSTYFGYRGLEYLKYEDVDGDGTRDLWISPVRKARGWKQGILFLENLQSSHPPVRRLGTATRTGKGVLPRISTSGGPPRIGNPGFTLRLSDVPGNGTHYWLWISHVRMDVSILGMRVKVFPFRSLVARSEGTGERGGLVRVPFRIPRSPSLIGTSLFVQWVFPSKGAKNPLSLARSEALAIRLLPGVHSMGR